MNYYQAAAKKAHPNRFPNSRLHKQLQAQKPLSHNKMKREPKPPEQN